MEDKMMFFYDKEGDVLDVSIGEPKKALSREIYNPQFREAQLFKAV